MTEEKKPDFVFGINIPVNVPTEEEISTISDSIEDYFKTLISSGHMNTEEAIAYIKFVSHLSSYVPFMIDGFLKSYRENKERKAAMEDNGAN